MSVNYLDIAVVVIVIGLGFIGYFKGFVKSCFGLLPLVCAVAGSYFVYPFMSKVMRGTFIYESIKNSVGDKLNLEQAVSNSIYSSQSELINSLNAPEFLKNALISNNNSVVYDILDVSGIEEYIAGFISNVSINIISVVVAFVAIFVVIKLIIRALDFASDLPVLSFVNQSCGFAVGIIKGLVIIWMIGIFLTFFYYSESFTKIFQMLNDSVIALFMYENNYLLFMILKIIA